MKKLIALLILCSGQIFAATAPIKVSGQVINFTPTRNTEVGRAFISVRCLREASSWEDLVPRSEKTLACTDFKLNGKAMGKYQWEKSFEMKKLGPNQFEVEALDVSFSTARKGHACIRVTATLENGTFVDALDEWSLLGFCSVPVLPFQVDADIYNNHRSATLNDFKNALFHPIEIKTK